MSTYRRRVKYYPKKPLPDGNEVEAIAPG